MGLVNSLCANHFRNLITTAIQYSQRQGKRKKFRTIHNAPCGNNSYLVFLPCPSVILMILNKVILQILKILMVVMNRRNSKKSVALNLVQSQLSQVKTRAMRYFNTITCLKKDNQVLKKSIIQVLLVEAKQTKTSLGVSLKSM